MCFGFGELLMSIGGGFYLGAITSFTKEDVLFGFGCGSALLLIGWLC